MRLIAHVMIFLLAVAALLHSVFVKVEMNGRQLATGDQPAETSGSIVIYKTPQTPGWSLLQQVHGSHPVSSLPECPIGFCQDV